MAAIERAANVIIGDSDGGKDIAWERAQGRQNGGKSTPLVSIPSAYVIVSLIDVDAKALKNAFYVRPSDFLRSGV